MATDIAIVGSLNRDLTILTPRLPIPGETVLGTKHYYAGGGKGANQAVAAARIGASVSMIGAVGDDDHGSDLVGALRNEGVETGAISIRAGDPTGLAVITVDSGAENTIVVSPGANTTLSPADVVSAAEVISGARVVLAQLEVPIEAVIAAAELTQGVFCLNPAPSRDLPRAILERVDVLIPNRSELADLAGAEELTSFDEMVEAVNSLGAKGRVVVTLGAEGALIVDGGAVETVAAPVVDAKDPTGAGDAFCGAIAHGLASGLDLEAATRRAVVAGAIAATRHGAQPSMPTASELDAFLDS